MNKSNLWSLRLGFSNKQAENIEQLGFEKFLKSSFNNTVDTSEPDFMLDEPKTTADLLALRQQVKNADTTDLKKIIKKQIKKNIELKRWWIEKIQNEEFPLREKMTCFWHNHFVATAQKVKVTSWVYTHNQILRENAFGNYKTITKKMLYSNAVLKYLDNTDNKADKINENLSRELLELFTLGIGNYNENDIKNGAKALAGLTVGDNGIGIYRPRLEDNSDKTYLGKTGNWKADDLVDLIFEQKAIPYFLTRKILKWFIYDTPKEELVTYYGDYFRKVNFEMTPFLTKIFTEEYGKNNSGSKIKDPLVYLLQLLDALQIDQIPEQLLLFFIKQQGMDLYNQVNVKGWQGGNDWLTSQNFLQRNNTADLLCSGKTIQRKFSSEMENEAPEIVLKKVRVNLQWNRKSNNNKEIIADLSNKFLFNTDEIMQKDMEKILKYDFNPKDEHADNAVLRLFNYITKTPEYQLI